MNPELDNFSCDWLFHFGLEFQRDAHLFSGVKFICTGGSEKRILAFAKMAQAQYGGECKFILVEKDLTISSNQSGEKWPICHVQNWARSCRKPRHGHWQCQHHDE